RAARHSARRSPKRFTGVGSPASTLKAWTDICHALLLLTGALRFFEAFLDRAIDLFEQRLVARIPVLDVARLPGAIEVVAGVPELVDLARLHDLHHFEADVAQRFDLGVPQHRIGFELGLDLRRRQLGRVGAGAVVLVAGGREWTRNLQQVDAFGDRHRAE